MHRFSPCGGWEGQGVVETSLPLPACCCFNLSIGLVLGKEEGEKKKKEKLISMSNSG